MNKNSHDDNPYGVTASVAAPVRTRRDVQSHTGNSRASGTLQCSRPTRSNRNITSTSVNESSTSSDESGTFSESPRRLALPNRRAPPLGNVRRRKKWSSDDNSDLLRAYLRATKYDTCKFGFRKRMLIEWRLMRPESVLTENQLATQLTSIKRNNLVPEIITQTIRTEEMERMRRETDNSNTIKTNNDTENAEINVENEQPQIDKEEQIETTRMDQEIETKRTELINEDKIRIINHFEVLKLSYQDTEANHRPSLRKIKPNKKVHTLLQYLNNYIRESTTDADFPNIEAVQTIVYCVARAVTEEVVPEQPGERTINKPSEVKVPKWKERIEKKINRIRSTLNKINDWKKNKGGRKLRKEVKSIMKSMNLKMNDEHLDRNLAVKINEMKQKIAVFGKKLRRYNLSHKRKTQNKLFSKNEKTFYASLNNTTTTPSTSNTVPIGELEEFWRNIWKNKGDHKNEAPWIVEEKQRMNETPGMESCNITITDVHEVVRKLHNWKAPGPDKIQNFWWKNLTAVHSYLVRHINNIIEHPEETPQFITLGITYMKAKSEDLSKPQNYRPITCLNTLYKIITSLLANKIDNHVDENQILTEEQKGCRRKTQGCKEQLIIDGIIANEAKKRHRNVSVAWLDYQKAFDSVPHSYLIDVLNIYKVNGKIVNFLQHCMKSWRTQLLVNNDRKTSVKTNPIPIESGIFQGDSLSPILFIICLNPLSRLLQSSNLGYKLKGSSTQRLSHLLYVDDAKLYAENEQDLGKLLTITKTFSENIRMKFGYDKCAKIIYKKGKKTTSQNIEHLNIKELDDTEKYKYLGLDQHLIRDTKELKDKTEKKLHTRINKILNTSLNGKNKVKAVNTWAIPTITYTFGVIQWSQTDLERIDRKIRTDMTANRIHHTNASVIRLYLPRRSGGRGLLNLEHLWKKQIINLRKYFKEKQTPLLKVICEIDSYSPLKLKNNDEPTQAPTIREKREEWQGKALHGKYPKALDSGHQTESTSWLTSGSLYGETEGFMCAIQDGVISTKNYKKCILKEDIDDHCRMCKTAPETIQHITSGCPTIAHTEYLKRHNLTAGILHQKIVTKLKLQESEDPYYTYVPQPVIETDSWKVYWDITIRTDKTVAANRPDIVLHDKQRKEAFFIDIAHPNDNNLEKTEREKITKYFELSQEYKAIYKLNKVTVLPIIITSTGIISKNMETYLSKIHLDNKPMIRLMQKSVILETCRIVRKFLNIQE
ncbi:uncharacterized protein LOC135266755 [Tribolium castaneum]